MRILVALVVTLIFAGAAHAAELAGVHVEPSVSINDNVLKLNGSGIRKKFLMKIYIGSLYASKRLNSAAEALRDNGDKLIRVNFLHDVDKGKVTEGFRIGLTNNAPELADSAEAKKFLAFFSSDFKRGDSVDLFLGGNGTVLVKHNGKVLGTLSSPRLALGILSIYLGDKPADEGLKKGMLGKG